MEITFRISSTDTELTAGWLEIERLKALLAEARL